MRVCLDNRRSDKGGIWRVSCELFETLSCRDDIELILLSNNADSVGVKMLDTVESIAFDPPHLSYEEYIELPDALENASLDLFITPQFYNTPNISVPLVSWVHDAWPLTNPQWLPPMNSAFKKHGGNSHLVAKNIMQEYARLRQQGLLFPNNEFLANNDKTNSEPSLAIITIAMFALNLHRSLKIVTCSEFSSNEITSLFPELIDDIKVIYNPVPQFKEFSNSSAEVSNDIKILHVSKWEPRKNMVRLIQAFDELAEKLPNVELNLVGRAASEDDQKTVSAAIQCANYKAKIVCHGEIEDGALYDLYQQASVLVVPSLHEGFAIPIVEAFNFNLPVVASNRGAIPEICDGAALLFDPEKPSDIADSMFAVLNSSDLQTRLSKSGRLRAEGIGQYSFSGEIEKLIKEAKQASRQ